MSGREVIALLVVLAALATAVAGVVAIAGGLSLTLAQRSARAGTSREQWRSALRVIRTGSAPSPDQRALMALVAAGLASHGGLAVVYLGLALTSSSIVTWPLAQWMKTIALAPVAATGNALVAVVLATWWGRGRRWLAAHRDPAPAVQAKR